MATKLDNVVTYNFYNEKSYNCLSTIPRASKLDRLLTARLEDPTHQVMWSFDHMVMWKSENKSMSICISTTHVAAKRGRVEA